MKPLITYKHGNRRWQFVASHQPGTKQKLTALDLTKTAHGISVLNAVYDYLQMNELGRIRDTQSHEPLANIVIRNVWYAMPSCDLDIPVMATMNDVELFIEPETVPDWYSFDFSKANYEWFRFALNDNERDVRYIATKQCGNYPDLLEIALRDEHWRVREAATGQCENHPNLLQIALNDNEREVRYRATKQCGNYPQLLQIALKDEDTYVRVAAVQRCANHTDLLQIALGDEESHVRYIATKQCGNYPDLLEIALSDEDWLVRKAAARRCGNHTDLLKMALSDEDWVVREAAARVNKNN